MIFLINLSVVWLQYSQKRKCCAQCELCQHYDAVMRYVNKGPLFFDVQMHRPTIATRSFMDSLLAFWPGLQVR